MTSWSPSTPNGWWPRIWATGDRVWVSYGNQQCYLAELLIVDGRLKLVREAMLSSGHYGGHWIRPFILTAFRPEANDRWTRWEMDVRGPWDLVPTDDDPFLVAGNEQYVGGGSWASWLSNGRLVLNNHQLAPLVGPPTVGPVGGAGAVNGPWLVHGATPARASIAVRRDGVETQIPPCAIPNYFASRVSTAGRVVYGGYGPIVGFDGAVAGSEHVDLTASPWRFEGPQAVWERPDGTTWVMSTTWGNETGYVILRPWAETACVVLERNADWATVAELAGAFLVATSDDHGRGVVDMVPTDSARRVLVAVPPPVVDEPPTTVPAIAPWPCRVSFFFDDPRNPNHLQRDARLRSSDGTRWLALSDVSDALVFCTLPGTREGTDAGLADAIAEARRTGKPLGAYRDTFDYPPSAVPSVPGVEVIPIVNAYPWRRADGMEPVYDAYVRLHATVADLRAAGHARIGFALATYRQIGVGGDLAVYNWPIQYVADLFGLVCELAREQGVRDLFCFEYSRANGKDGIVSRPELITLTVRLLEAAQPVIDTTPEPIPDPAPTPAPDPHEDDMPKTNPTDSITYAALVAALAPRDVGRNYTDGCLDAYRAVAEGTPLATVAAGESHPTQAPLPAVPYLVWAATALGLLAIRQMAGKGTGYGDGVIDTYRRFGGERWPLEFVIADIEGAALPDRPWPSF